MSVSASRRTWEEASSPAAVRLARDYEQAWRDTKQPGRRPDPQAFLAAAASASIDGPGARLALLRADLSLRWEAGDKAGARWYLDRHSDLSEDTIVALVYEEFCLLEDDDERPEPDAFLARYPEVAKALRRVLDIHGLVGSGSTMAVSFNAGNGSGEHACAFPEAGQTIAGFSLVEELGRGAFARVFLAQRARAGGSAGRPQGDAARVPGAADSRPAPAYAHRAGPLAPDRQGDRTAPAVHAVLRPDDPGPGPRRCPRP